MRVWVALIAGFLIGCQGARAEPSHEISIDALLDLEAAVSNRHGRPVRCLLGYQSCLVYLSVLDDKTLGKTRKSTVALVPPYRKAAVPKDISLLSPANLFQLTQKIAKSPPAQHAPPDWELHDRVDDDFYARIWRDRILNVTLALGYSDQGAGKNPSLFNYGAYAVIKDRIRRFSIEWSMAWEEVDDLESIAEVRIGPDRLLRLRIIDPHRFCADDRVRIDKIESAITRDPNGLILKFADPAVFSRKDTCAVQEEASAEARRRFVQALSGVRGEDIVLYQGHSRYGRGPDFGPFFGKSGKLAPKALIQATVDSQNLAAVYFNGCSIGKNYGSFVARAVKAGKIVVGNTMAPSTTDAVDDLLLFVQSVTEKRALSAIERYLNLVQSDGKWPSQVRITRH